MIPSGTAQGSVLRPPFLLVYITDLTKEVESPHFMFADNLEHTGHPRAGGVQQDGVHRWCAKRKLAPDTDACRLLTDDANRRRPKVLGAGDNPVAIKKVVTVRDLEVRFQN